MVERCRLGWVGPWLILMLWLVMMAAPLVAESRGGVAVEGTDRARTLPPIGALVEPYRNAGYSLEVVDGEAQVRIDTAPLDSRSRFVLPAPSSAGDAVERLARSLTTGAATEYEAVSRILGWLARNMTYTLDREVSQEALDVLARREGYCTGIARLAVAMLDAVAIPAREVAGWVAGSGAGAGAGTGADIDAGTGDAGERDGFHRWIEVRLGDRGWVFSDPLTTHHYVPANYVRLASESLRPSAGTRGLLLERDDRRGAVDLYPAATSGITARRNDDRQLAAALRVRVEDERAGTAVLVGDSHRRIHALDDGTATFIGLDPGRYTLQLLLPGRALVERPIDLPGRVRTALFLPRARTAPAPQTERPPTEEGLR